MTCSDGFLCRKCGLFIFDPWDLRLEGCCPCDCPRPLECPQRGDVLSSL